MDNEKILEFNKKCSEFLGFKSAEFDDHCYEYDPFRFYGYISKMKFHDDWNWIMEVVEKIQSLDNFGAIVMIQQSRCKITSTSRIFLIYCGIVSL